MSQPKKIDKYEIIEEIGRGGFGIVYRARDADLKREVALKVMPASITLHGDLADRFLQEAQATAQLKHPHIANVLDYGDVEGTPYIALEYAPGRSLRQLLDERGTLPLDQALIILSQLASALDYAHERGFVHRDVKPSNVIVEFRNEGPYAVLTDFGLVKALQQVRESQTTAGTLFGTFEYMAPEACDLKRVAEVGPAADLYSLGVVAYEMLTGRVPFLGGNDPAVLNSQINQPPPDPCVVNRDLSQSVAKALLKMLGKSTKERYASGREFVQALRDTTKERSRPVWLKVAGAVAILAIALMGLAWATGAGPFGAAPTPTSAPTFTQVVVVITPTAPATATPPPPAINTQEPLLTPSAGVSPTPTSEATQPTTTSPTATEPPPTNTPTNTPIPPPAFRGLLAYPEYDAGRQTFSVKIYDLAQKQVIDTVDRASQPAISPNGQRIAYHSWDTSAQGLFWKSVAAPDSARKFSGLLDTYRPQWRDDEHLVFTLVQGGAKDIRYADNTGIRTPGMATTPAWLPDGRLIYNGCLDIRCGLMTADEGGGNSQLVTDRTGDLTPAVAPDGQQAAFMSDRDGNWEIYLLALQGQTRTVTRLTDNPARDGLPVFSPDGSRVAFVSDRGGQWGIWSLDWQKPGSEILLLPIPGGIEGSVASVSSENQPGWTYESISWRKK